MTVLIVGAGGHAAVVADILLAMKRAGAEVELIGFVDDNPGLHGSDVFGLPVIGPLSILRAEAADGFIVAIGDNQVRRTESDRLSACGARLVTACHPRAIVANDVIIGDGSMVCAGAIVGTGSVVGRGVIVNTGATVDHHNIVEPFSHLAPGVHTGGRVHIGTESLVGIGATVMAGRTIGSRAIVGAGAVVVDDVPPGLTVTGVPARAAS